MDGLHQTLSRLKDRYCELHTTKEDLFWTAKMGLARDPAEASNQLAEAEKAFNAFVQNPEQLKSLKALSVGDAGPDPDRINLSGWVAMLDAHVVGTAEGRKISDAIIELEKHLARKRMGMELGYKDPHTGEFVPASSNKLRLIMRTDSDQGRRRAAFDGMRSVERFVLDNGFLEIVKKRNQLARILGHHDFYAWRLAVVERMTKRRLFDMLNDLEQRTRERTHAQLASFAEQHGEDSLHPWNFSYLRSGSLTQKLDPYFSFAPSLERWMRSFNALGVRFRGATLTLDLVDRPGKYDNGFMHGPEPAFFDDGQWRPARINFSANAVVGQVGSGLRATQTLFHEGGHAAHFSNILANAPCFSQEFAPTSVAYAETQSMFMDSLLDDADWQHRYARNAEGGRIPTELIETAIRENQPFRGWEMRAMMTVPFAERCLYELPDEALTGDRVLSEFREVEQRLQGLSEGVRPVLAVPHLLESEASAYYHGYVLATMAVHQKRQFFLERDGYLTDNPRIGPDLAKECWAAGNAKPFDDILKDFTGSALSATALVKDCNASADEKIAEARLSLSRSASREERDEEINLDGTVRVIHGGEPVTNTADVGYEGAGRDFAEWIRALESEAARS